MINTQKTIRSFRFAWQGLIALFRFENNARFHLLAALVVVVSGWYLNLNSLEWLIVTILVSLVWMAEAFNTAIEKLADRITTDQDPIIGHAKDLAAGGVLMASIAAFIGGCIIFGPKLYHLIFG